MITGYRVTNTVNVTVRDLSKTGSVIDAAADSGVSTTAASALESVITRSITTKR